MSTKIIQQGAEAKIILVNEEQNSFIIKDRISKSYRIPELDKKIIKKRTKSETKLLTKASEIINSPKPLETKEFNKIKMPYIKGKKLSEHLDEFPLSKQKEICKTIGQEIAKLHEADIIHSDLTTSNMILVEEKPIKKVKEQFSELINLKLPKKEYAVFGSGPLAIREIRKKGDIDIIVTSKLWEKLSKKYEVKDEKINIKGIEIYKTWLPWFKNVNKLINDSDVFDEIQFVKLKYVLEWKKEYAREKDLKDIELIKKYQTNKDYQIFLIDFGLGYISRKFEDKAVDLHLLKQALEAKHFKHWKELFDEVEKGYKNYKESKKVLERLKAVEKRGRYKH